MRHLRYDVTNLGYHVRPGVSALVIRTMTASTPVRIAAAVGLLFPGGLIMGWRSRWG